MMLSKNELCNELVKFSKINLGSEFNKAYENEEACFKDFEKILDSNSLNAISEVDDAITDLLLGEDMENENNQIICEYFLKLAYKINIYNKHFKDKNKDAEKDI